MRRIAVLAVAWGFASGCGALPIGDGRTPEGTWWGTCSFEVVGSDFTSDVADYEFQLDVTVEDGVAAALEVCRDRETDACFWRYDGTWVDPSLELLDDTGQLYVLTMSTDGEILAGDYTYPSVSGTSQVVGDCELARTDTIVPPH